MAPRRDEAYAYAYEYDSYEGYSGEYEEYDLLYSETDEENDDLFRSDANATEAAAAAARRRKAARAAARAQGSPRGRGKRRGRGRRRRGRGNDRAAVFASAIDRELKSEAWLALAQRQVLEDLSVAEKALREELYNSVPGTPVPAHIAAAQEKRDALARALARDEASLAAFEAALGSAKEATGKIFAELDRVEARLEQVEDLVLPIHTVTTQLQRTHANLEETIGMLEEGLAHYSLPDELAQVVSQPARQERYTPMLAALARIDQSIDYFTEHPNYQHASSSIATLSTMRSKVLANLGDLVIRVAKAVGSKPLSPSEYVGAPAPFGGQALPMALDGARVLLDVSPELARAGYASHEPAVATARREGLLGSLKMAIHDTSTHGSRVGGESGGGIGGGGDDEGGGGGGGAGIDGKGRKKRRHHGGHGRHDGGGGGGGGGGGSDRRRSKWYAKGSLPFLVVLDVFLDMLRVERGFAQKIFAAERFDTHFKTVVEGAVDEFVRVGRGALDAVDTGNAPLAVMDMVARLSDMFLEFSAVVRASAGAALTSALAEFVESLNGQLRTWLTSFVSSVGSHSTKHVPKDGTVHEHTANTLGYLRSLLDYGPLLDSRLPAVPWREADGVGAAASVSAEDPAGSPLSEYVSKVLSRLENNILDKARSYKSDALRHVFLLNNYHYAVSSVLGSGLVDLVTEGVLGDLKAGVERARRRYQETWDKAMTYLLDVNQALKADLGPDTKLSKSERESIKSRFSKFNSEFDGNTAAAAHYTLADPDLRAAVKQETKDRILPLYVQFVERYRDVPFTKNLYKYLKYLPETVEEKLDRLFL